MPPRPPRDAVPERAGGVDAEADEFPERNTTSATPADLAWINGSEAPTVCSASACEAKVPLTRFGAGTSVSLFARIGSATGSAFSNQTLPADAFGMSSVVTLN